MVSFKHVVMAFALMISGLMVVHAPAQASGTDAALSALANQFNVSPDLLGKFSKMGLSKVDLGHGLQLAKSIVGKGELSMGDAAEKVLSLTGEGQDWMQIAKDFDVELPDFSAGDAMEKMQKLTTE